MKDRFITITGMKHYYGLTPFKVGKKVRCESEQIAEVISIMQTQVL